MSVNLARVTGLRISITLKSLHNSFSPELDKGSLKSIENPEENKVNNSLFSVHHDPYFEIQKFKSGFKPTMNRNELLNSLKNKMFT